MTGIVKPLSRLEGRIAPVVDPKKMQMANLVWERWRRRLEGSNLPFVEKPRVPMTASGRPMSVAETLRYLRRARLAAMRAGAE